MNIIIRIVANSTCTHLPLLPVPPLVLLLPLLMAAFIIIPAACTAAPENSSDPGAASKLGAAGEPAQPADLSPEPPLRLDEAPSW